MILGGLWVLYLGAGAAHAQDAEPVWGGGGEVDTNYRYLWRGLLLSDKAAIQPSAWLWFMDGEFLLWSSLPLPGDDAALLELDPVLSWTFYAGSVEIAPALTGYLYPNAEGSSGEIAVGVTVPAGMFSVYTNQTLDFVVAPGAWYGSVGGTIAPPISDSVSLEGKVDLSFASGGYNGYYTGVSRAGVNTVGVSLGSTITFGAFYLRPHAEMAYWLDKELATAVGTPLPFNVGLALGLDY